MSKLKAAHKTVYTIVRAAIDTYDENIVVSVGDRIQANKGPEVIINQSTFDVTNLSTADYSVFEFNVNCYSKNYLIAAELADLVYDQCPASDEVYPFESTNWLIDPLDLFMEYSDRDDYQASVLIRLRDAGE